VKGKTIRGEIFVLLLLCFPIFGFTNTIPCDFGRSYSLVENEQVYQFEVEELNEPSKWSPLKGAQPSLQNKGYAITFKAPSCAQGGILFLKLPRNEFILLAQGKDTLKAGTLTPVSERAFEKRPDIFEIPESWRGKKLSLILYNSSSLPTSLDDVVLLSAREFYRQLAETRAENKLGTTISIFFQGAIWMMMLYMLVLYFQNNRDKLYLYYGLYMFMAMYYMLLKISSDGPFYFMYGEGPHMRQLTNEPVQWLIYIFYHLFVLYFLEVKKFNPRLYRLVKGINAVYVAYFLFICYYLLFTFDSATVNQLYVITRPIVLAIGVFLIIKLYLSVRTKLTKYIVIGSSIFMLMSAIAMYNSLYPSHFQWTSLHPINWMQIGIMLELLCFSLGLGHRIRMSNYEKSRMHQAYVDQLVRNEEIVQEHNRELEEEVRKQTDEVKRTTKALEEEKQRKIEADYQRQLMNSEMQSLRLQMNPHFIFNSLNSIRYYILKDDTEKASEYITIFSKLLRMILQNSKQQTVMLTEELKALKLYLDFESQRFENKFSYELKIADNVELESTRIQPLIIQPFVENSIWHGLLHKDGVGHLKIELRKQGDGELVIVVEDDGIGREKAKELSRGKHKHKSLGMQITRDRLKLMQQIKDMHSGFEIEDLVSPAGEPLGTRVTIKLK